jgi:oligopeptide transport system substrate-binding protein
VAATLCSILALAGLLLVACTPAPPAPAPTDRPSQAAPVAEPPAPPAPTATIQPREQTLRLPLTEPPTIDPGLAEDGASVEIVSQLFEPLVGFDEKGDVSGLGADNWEVSPDGLTYTLSLRQGATWSDGRPVVAQDYAWAWKRNVNPATASPEAGLLFPIKNAQAISEGKLEPDQLGVQARDDRTLIVSLETPAAYFLRLASSWPLAPLRRDVLEKFGDGWTDPRNIVTNGPFRLKAWQHDSQIDLERNEAYWGPKPTLRRALYRIFPQGGGDQALAAYEAGELEATSSAGAFELPPNQIDRLLADPKLKSEARLFDQSATLFIVVNARRPHLADPRVRLALGQALDRPKTADQEFKGAAKPAYSLQPEGIAGRRPEAWVKDDAAAAQKLLAEAGYPEGRGFPEISLTYNTAGQWTQLATSLQRRWKDILGINLRLESMEWSAFLAWRRGEEWVQRGDLFRGGWFSDYEDPHDWYNVLWDSGSDPRAFNSGWKDDRYDTLVRQAAGEPDRARRVALYGQAEELLAAEYPAIPLVHYGIRALVKPYVQGFEPDRVVGLTPLKKISLSDAR